MTVALLLQVNLTNVHAISDVDNTNNTTYYSESLDKIKEELSKNGNKVTQYVNDEDKKLKTIVWTKGVHTPPKMGGIDADFKKYVTSAGSFNYVDYKAPFISGQGWYDVNKSEDREPDLNLCFAASASNSLHWWFAQNSEYIDKYLQQNPNAPRAEEIKKLRNSFKNQQDSDIYKIFVRQFGHKKEGYWPDILQDQFINGYYPKPNGGTNDSPADEENLITKGPDRNGGFFYNVFGTTRLTKRHYYYFGYDAVSNDLKNYFLNGDIVLMTYSMGAKTHVVTLWGAEFDDNGKISAVYFSDSDDEKMYGMQRYRVVNSSGKAVVTTRDDGKGTSYIENLEILSSGRQIWEDKLNLSKKQLELVWDESNFTYNGNPQKPTVSVKNIQSGHDVRVSVSGEMTNVGTYTATAVLEGKDADKYQLPEQHTKVFTINKAQANVVLNANVNNDKTNRSVNLTVAVNGVNNHKLNGSVTFKDGDTVIKSNIPVTNGVANYSWENVKVGNYNVVAEFIPSNDEISKNYNNGISNIVNVNIQKLQQDKLSIKPILDKKFGDENFKLEVIGGSGSGAVRYSCDKNDVISINGDTVTILGAGTAKITATKLGDEFYNDATATYDITIAKAKAPQIEYPTASNITYGQKLADSKLTGGSTKYGTFSWKNENTIPTVNNSGYEVVFTPNENTIKNYEEIPTKNKVVEVKVSKASPKARITSNILNDNGVRKVELKATVQKIENGENTTGTVKFVNITDNKDIATKVSIKDGVATYTWTGLENKVYKVKAVYSGDENYNLVSSEEISVDATKKTQTNFKISEIGKKTYGDKSFTINTTGGNGVGLVTYKSSDESILSIDGNTATIHKAGKVTITATKLGDEFYEETNSSTTLVIDKRELTVTAEDKLDIIKGSSMPTFTYKINGLVNNDKLISQPTITTQVQDTSKVGEYEIVISDINLTNIESYDVIYVNGKMTIINPKDETTENPNQNNGQQNTDKPSTNKPSNNTNNQNTNKPSKNPSNNQIINRPNNNQNDYQSVKDNIINKVVSSNKKQDVNKVDIVGDKTNKKDNNDLVSNNKSDKEDTISKSDNSDISDKNKVQNSSEEEKTQNKKDTNIGFIILLVVILIAVITTIFIIAFNLTKKNYLKKQK